jgi:hypothetical protein
VLSNRRPRQERQRIVLAPGTRRFTWQLSSSRVYDCIRPYDIPQVETQAVKSEGKCIQLKDRWVRSICPGIEYPNFQQNKIIHLPERLAQELPKLSGFIRYEKHSI